MGDKEHALVPGHKWLGFLNQLSASEATQSPDRPCASPGSAPVTLPPVLLVVSLNE